MGVFNSDYIRKRMTDIMKAMQEHSKEYQSIDSEWDKFIDSIDTHWDGINVVQMTDTPSWNKALDKVLKDIQESCPDCLDENGFPKEDYKVPISMIFAIIAANYDNGMVWN